jgi:hypothetical protein
MHVRSYGNCAQDCDCPSGTKIGCIFFRMFVQVTPVNVCSYVSVYKFKSQSVNNKLLRRDNVLFVENL